MRKPVKPARDPQIAPSHSVSRDGQPLSYNRAPAPDLEPWIARLYVAKVAAPDGYCMSCGLLSDTAFIRIQLAGKWVAQTRDGELTHEAAALFCGPHTRRMPISVTGGFISLGASFRPGVMTALGGPGIATFFDRIVTVDLLQMATLAPSAFDPDAEPEDLLTALEDWLRKAITDLGAAEPDAITARFEMIAFRDPTMTIAQAARECGVERRALERRVSRDFGMPPKQVLRRARTLDMASHLRGVADDQEAAELALRYYDESHLIHEFTDLLGMSPRQFTTTPQPIMTLALELRQARRLEALRRIAPGESRPWE